MRAKNNYFDKNELDKACFSDDSAYSDSKDLAKRTTLGKILRDKSYENDIHPKSNGYQIGLATMV